MKDVQIKVEDSSLEILLTKIKNLRKDIVKEVIVKDASSFSIPKVSDEENKYYKEILKNMTTDDKIIVSEKSFTI